MSDALYNFWCYVEGDNTYFQVVASPTIRIDDLKALIKVKKSNLLQKVDASSLMIWKVDVIYNGETRKQIEAREYRPAPNDQVLNPSDIVSNIWERPTDGRLDVFVGLPSKVGDSGLPGTYPSDALSSLHAAEKLHKSTWRQGLESRLQDVDQCDGLKFLPAAVVDDLQLRKLGCAAKAILVREEYYITLRALEGRQNNTGGMIVTGHPGIGKSVFIFFALLHLLSKGKCVALQRDTIFFIFRQDGVEMHSVNSLGLFFRPEERLWALSDSTEANRLPCNAFQTASRMGYAWLVQATSPATNHYDRLMNEINAGLFVMNSLTREESRAVSIIYGLNVERFIKNYDKWGPSGRTCLQLAWGTMSEEQLELKLYIVAKKFAEHPTAAITMDANSVVGDFHLLFTTLPGGPNRDLPTLRVATRHVHEFIVRAIASIDAAKQTSFYSEASNHPFFRGAFGYVFEKYFYVWLSSSSKNELLCTAATSTAHDQAEQLIIRPVGLKKVIIHEGASGENGYKTANRHKPPFSWVPASRSEVTFDAIICTSTNIITIQITVAAEHSVDAEGFKKLKQYLPKRFQNARRWCHVFVTNHADSAAKLGRKAYTVADEMDVSIYTAVLDIALFKFPLEVLKHAKAPRSIGMDSDGIGIEMEVDAEGE